MKRTFSLYPRNKISTSNAMFEFPLRKINSYSSEKITFNNDCSTRRNCNKSIKIKKMIQDINISNLNHEKKFKEPNNIYEWKKLLLEEKIKNKNLCENIILLNKHIDELEYRINNNCLNIQNNNNLNVNDELFQLKQENQELKLFKEKVYSFSVKYDELNNDIINCLKSIEKIVEFFNYNDPNKNFEYQSENINNISNNFESIIDKLTNYMTIKQEEYNMLLIEKESEIEKMKNNGFNMKSDDFSNGLKSSKILNTNMNNTFEYKNRTLNNNKSYRSSRQKHSRSFFNICEANDFNFSQNAKNNKYKNMFDIL